MKAQNIRTDESYSQLLATEGAITVVDENLNYEVKLPEWADGKKIQMGQRFFIYNMNAIAHGIISGLFAVLPVESLTKILMFTKQSSTPALANALHAQTWLQNPIKPGSLAWDSILTIRRMHVAVNKRSTKADVGIISQKDMAITQFLFMGFALLMPEKFGVVGSYEQLDAFNHFWRLIGYLLGTENRFNVCGETVEETQSRLQAMVTDMLLPEWKDPFPGCIPYAKTTFDGVWSSVPTTDYGYARYASKSAMTLQNFKFKAHLPHATMFMMKRAIGLPGYYYFAGEPSASGFEEENRNIFANLSMSSRLHIFLEIVIYEYLSHVFIFRWIFNFCRILVALLDMYPIIAWIRFGRKYAFVDIFKSKMKKAIEPIPHENRS